MSRPYIYYFPCPFCEVKLTGDEDACPRCGADIRDILVAIDADRRTR